MSGAALCHDQGAGEDGGALAASARVQVSSQRVTLGWVRAQVASCPTLCVTYHSRNQLTLYQEAEGREKTLPREIFFSSLTLSRLCVCLSNGNITMRLHPAGGKECLLHKTLRCTLRSTWLAKVVVREKTTKQHNIICCTYWKVRLVFYNFWTRTVGDFFISDEFKWCSTFAPLRHSVPCVQGQNSTI